MAIKFPFAKSYKTHESKKLMNPKQNKPGENHIISCYNKISETTDTEKTLKAAREKRHISYRRINIRMTIEFLSEIIQARSYTKIHMNFFGHPNIFCPSKKTEGKRTIFF